MFALILFQRFLLGLFFVFLLQKKKQIWKIWHKAQVHNKILEK